MTKFEEFCRDFEKATAAVGDVFKLPPDPPWTRKRAEAARQCVAFCQAVVLQLSFADRAAPVAYRLLGMAVDGAGEETCCTLELHTRYDMHSYTRQQVRDLLSQTVTHCWKLQEWDRKNNFMFLIGDVRMLLEGIAEDLDRKRSDARKAA